MNKYHEHKLATCLYQEFGDKTFAFNVIIFEAYSMSTSKPLQYLLKSCKHPEIIESNIPSHTKIASQTVGLL